MNEAMEDGEIIDSDREEFEKSISVNLQRVNTPGHKYGPPLPKKMRHSSELESDAEKEINCTDDDDDDKIEQINRVKHSKKRSITNKFGIWSNVMEDELLSGELNSWSGVNQKILNDRDVESYDFVKVSQISNSGKRRRCQNSSSDNASDTDEKNDLVKLETFGVSLNKNAKKEHSQTSKSKERIRGERHKNTRNEMFSVNENIFKSSTSIDDVVNELTTILREPPHMKAIFELAVNTIGTERIYGLARATEKIEASGGLLIANGRRRRTPGGVFLHLLKSHSTREEQDLIFIQEKNEKSERKKRSKESRRQLIDEKVQKLAHMVNSSQAPDDKLFEDSVAAGIELDFC